MSKRRASAGLHNNGQISKRYRSITPEDAPYATQEAAYSLDGAADEDISASSDGDDDMQVEDVVRAPPRSAYKIPAYTHENRTMRLYAGPLRKWDRRQALVNTVYGPRSGHISLFLELQQRFSRCTHPVAFRPLLTDIQIDPRGEVLVSPWLPANLEEEQQKSYRSWSRNYVQSMRAAGQVPFGEIEDVSESEAQPFLPWVANPDADLDIFANGIFNENVKAGVSFTPEGHETLTLDGPVQTPVFFNAGGKILSLAWAPMPTNYELNGALLAVAVVPHDEDDSNDSDDSNDDNNFDSFLNTDGAKQEKARLDERLGSIQFWRVTLQGKTGGPLSTASTYSDGTRLDSVCCFYWGWPKQLEWCPVQPCNNELYPGLLAVRTEDGVVRIIKPQKGCEEKPKYGKEQKLHIMC